MRLDEPQVLVGLPRDLREQVRAVRVAQFIQPANTLRLKVGGARFGGIDPEAVAKAEAALKNLSAQVGQWLDDELTKMDAARQLARILTEKGVLTNEELGAIERAGAVVRESDQTRKRPKRYSPHRCGGIQPCRPNCPTTVRASVSAATLPMTA